MLKGLLNSEGRRARGLFICFVCLELTREEAGGRGKKTKYIYILNSINKSQFVCEGVTEHRVGGRGVSYVL